MEVMCKKVVIGSSIPTMVRFRVVLSVVYVKFDLNGMDTDANQEEDAVERTGRGD